MPTVTCKVIKVETTQDGIFARLQLNGKAPQEGATVKLKWGKIRSLKSNALYWVMLGWMLEHGMKEQGYQFPEELHEAFKNRILCEYDSSKGFKTMKIGSTTELTSDAFMEYIEKCESLVVEYCGMDMKPFWVEYATEYSGMV